MSNRRVLQDLVEAGKPMYVQSGSADRHFAKFEQWIASHGFETSDANDELLSLYLFANYDRWSYGSAFNVAQGIRWVSIDKGLGNPMGPLTSQYLSTLRTDKGLTTRKATDAVSVEEVEEMVQTYRRASLKGQALARQAFIVVGGALLATPNAPSWVRTHPLTTAAEIPLNAFNETETLIRVTDPTSNLEATIDARSDPLGFEIVQSALHRFRGQRPLLGSAGKRKRNTWVDEVARFTRASGTQWQISLASLSGTERTWALRDQDRHFQTTVTAVAYFLLGVVTARRSAELSRLTLEDVCSTADSGYEFTIGTNEKSAQAAIRQGGYAKSRTYLIGHIAGTPTGACSPICPACALALLLTTRRRSGATEADLLFVTSRGMSCGPDYGRHIVRQMCQAAGIDTSRVFGSRAMRVSGATLASRNGIPEIEIAEMMMCSVTNVRRYNRHNPYPDGDPLPLCAPHT